MTPIQNYDPTSHFRLVPPFVARLKSAPEIELAVIANVSSSLNLSWVLALKFSGWLVGTEMSKSNEQKILCQIGFE